MGAAKNLLGMKFGKLYVVEKDERKYKDKNIRWKCLCDCQLDFPEDERKYTYVKSSALLNGNTTSCGCLRYENRRKDLTGKKYGESTVLEMLEYTGTNRRVLMKCECGNEYTTLMSTLYNNKGILCKTCRMKGINEGNDITGKKFGRLTVIEKTDVTKNGKIVWKCICDCQNNKPEDEKEYRYYERSKLTTGAVLSCGCFARENMSHVKSKYNKYDLSGEYGIGWTTNTDEEFYFDLEDYDKIKNYCWHTHYDKVKNYTRLEAYNKKYVDNDIIDPNVTMAQIVTGEKYYDHINRNTLDNRKSNLRNATMSQNSMNHSLHKSNTSGISGVQFDDGYWEAYISNKPMERICVYRGTSFDDAVVARLKAEKEYYGEFAPQQHLYEKYNVS